MRQITFWAYSPCIASGIVGPIDVLLTANILWSTRQQAGALFAWRIESLDGGPVKTASGMVLDADGPLGTGPMPDVLFLPGMALHNLDELRSNIAALKPHLGFLRPFYEAGVTLAANCSANFLLAEAGLLDDRAATTHWSLAREFRGRYPKVHLQAGEIMTEQDGLMCSGAATAYLDLALRIVENFGGQELAAETARLLLIDSNRSARMPSRGSAIQDHFDGEIDAVVSKSIRWMKKNLRRTFSMADLATHVNVSERTVSRRFTRALGCSPGVYLQLMRIEEAKRLLETTRYNIDTVCSKVGYSDTHFFRRTFKRATGSTPGDYRVQKTAHRAVHKTRQDPQRCSFISTPITAPGDPSTA